ncbi:MAG: hypothetical protein FGF48_06780 [Candidatus Brockarchaeota archaeon]|nr:hypothetical protein [Candidatus Brockarchaeota archaeon]
MVNPKIKKRLIDSLDYLRKMDFFKDYSNLTSEEILEKIFNNEINYACAWWYEEPRSHFPIPESDPHGSDLLENIGMYLKHWMKKSNFEIDRSLIPFDTKRVMHEAVETWIDDNMGIAILKRLARISRGVFQPTNISSRWMFQGRYKWKIQEVGFDFKGKRYSIQIVLRHDFLEDIGLRELNKLIEDTEYQYYQVEDDYITVGVLTKEEAEKLKKERGWKFEYIY